MSNYYQQIVNLVKQISGQKNTLGIPKIYIKITGDLTKGAFLSQVVFWSDQSKRQDKFFYRSAKEWEDELCLSYYKVTRIAKVLETEGLIETKLMRAEGAPTMHYRPVMDKIIALILEKLENRETSNSTNFNMEIEESQESIDFRVSLKSITETEITTERESAPPSKIDPLSHILSFQGKEISEASGPHPKDQFFGYRDAFVAEFQAKIGRYPNETEKDEITKLGQAEQADPKVWSQALRETILNWSGNGKAPLARVIEVYYAGGSYEAWRQKKYSTSIQKTTKLNDEQLAVAAKLDAEMQTL